MSTGGPLYGSPVPESLRKPSYPTRDGGVWAAAMPHAMAAERAARNGRSLELAECVVIRIDHPDTRAVEDRAEGTGACRIGPQSDAIQGAQPGDRVVGEVGHPEARAVEHD